MNPLERASRTRYRSLNVRLISGTSDVGAVAYIAQRKIMFPMVTSQYFSSGGVREAAHLPPPPFDKTVLRASVGGTPVLFVHDRRFFEQLAP